jgi:hypothetical protein
MPESNSRLLVETELRAYAHELDVALGEVDLSSAVMRRVELPAARVRSRERLRRRRRLVVALVAAVAATAVLAIPSARAAVTNFFDIGAVRVHEEPPPVAPAASGALRLGEPTTLDGARALMPVVMPTTDGLAAPDEVWFDAKAGGVTSLVYRAGPGLPEARHTDGIGLLVQEFTGDSRPFIAKYVTSDAQARRVAIGLYEGVFLSGDDHALFYEDPIGADVRDDGRLVGNAMIFQREGLTIRIEGDLSLDRMVAIAESLR